jgi:hypothetical protein
MFFILKSIIIKMNKNIGITDKFIRILSAFVILILYITGVTSGIFGFIMIVLAAIFVLTSLITFCPLYHPFKLNTIGKQK